MLTRMATVSGSQVGGLQRRDTKGLALRDATKVQKKLDELKPATDITCEGECLCADAVGSWSNAALLATGDSAGNAQLWSAGDGALLHTFKCDAKVTAVDLTNDELRLVAGDGAGMLSVFEVETGALLHRQDVGSPVTGVENSNDGSYTMVSCEGGTVIAVSTATWETLVTVEVGAPVLSMDLGRDGSLLATGDKNKRAILWHIDMAMAGTTVQQTNTMICAHNVLSVCLSIDCSLLATGDAMAKAKVWETGLGGKLLLTLDCAGWVHAVKFSGDMTMLATGDQGKQVRLWGVSSGEMVHKMELESEVFTLDLSRDKTTLTAGTKSGRARTWFIAPRHLSSFVAGDGRDVNSIDMGFSLLATGSSGKEASCWDYMSGECRLKVPCGGMALGVDLSGDETLLAVGEVTGWAKVWAVPPADAPGGAEPTSAEPLLAVKCRAVVFTVKISRDKRVLATGDVTGRASLWDMGSGELLAELECGSQVRSIDLSGDVCGGLKYHPGVRAGLIATGTGAGEAQVWDVAARHKRRSMACGGMVYSVDLSGDATLLATGDQHKQALLWDTATGSLLMRLVCGDVVKRVDLSADDRLLAVGAGSACEIWDVPSGTRVITWPEAGGRVKLASCGGKVACVNMTGQATLRRVLEPNVVTFWLPMIKDADALAAAVECIPSHALLMHAVTPSGRNLLAHSAAVGNLQILEKLIRSPTPPAPSSVLQVDCTGRHALDYALKNRNGRLAELLLAHALRMPPHQRMPLVVCGTASATGPDRESSTSSTLAEDSTSGGGGGHGEDANKPALVLMAHMFPHALQRQLEKIGIDTYGVEYMGASKASATNRRVKEECLTVDHGNMAVGGHAQPFEEERLWAELTGDHHALKKMQGGADGGGGDGGGGAKEEAPRSCWERLCGCFGGGGFLSLDDDDEEEGDTEVLGGVVGIPLIFDAPETPGYQIWEDLVEASESAIDLIATDAMRAAIGFKWQAYGEAAWRRQALLYAFFFFTYVMSCIYLMEDSNRGAKIEGEVDFSEPEERHAYLGAFFFALTSLINLYYLYLETREMRSFAYLTKAQNVFDLLSIGNIASLAPLLYYSHPLAPVLGSLGTMLMIPKMASISRGAERYSKLITMLSEIAADMVPFLTLMAFIIFANAFAFLLVSDREQEEFSTLSFSWFSAYTLMLGAFDKDVFGVARAGLPQWVMLAFFYYFTMFVNVVLLNVLISIIGDTYERVQANSVQVSLLQRANLLLDMEAHMSGNGGDSKAAAALKKNHPAWVHVVTRVEEAGGEDQWAGRLSAIKQMVSDLSDKIVQNENSVVTRLSRAMMGEIKNSEARIINTILPGGSPDAPVPGKRVSEETLRSQEANDKAAKVASPRKSLKAAGMAVKLAGSMGKSPLSVALPASPALRSPKFGGGGVTAAASAAEAQRGKELQSTLQSLRDEMREQAAQQAAQLAQTTEELKQLTSRVNASMTAPDASLRRSGTFSSRK